MSTGPNVADRAWWLAWDRKMGESNGRPKDAATEHVRRYLNGDDSARDWIIRRFSPGLRVVAEDRAKIIPGHCEPDDLVAEVWLVALPKLQSLAERNGRYTPVVLAFLRKILDFTVRNELRRQLRYQRHGGHGTARHLSKVPDDITGQVTRAIKNEQIERLRAHVEALPLPERQIVRFRAFEQVNNRTTAAMLQLPEATCSALYKRALDALKAAFPHTLLDDITSDDATP